MTENTQQQLPKPPAEPRAKSAIATDCAALDGCVVRHASSEIVAEGELSFPAVPALSDACLQRMQTLFAALGHALAPEQVEVMRSAIAQKLQEATRISSSSRLLVRYQPATPPQHGMVCQFSIVSATLAEKYQGWADTQHISPFGDRADAKVMAIAQTFDRPATCPVLDIGAGTGRNSLALARLGFPVDAVELAPVFAERLRSAAAGLPVRVVLGNILDERLTLPRDRYGWILLSEVISHFQQIEQVRQLFERACQCLLPGGYFLFNLFLTEEGYEPDAIARQWARLRWSCMFTRSELGGAIAGLPLQILSDESAFAYEKQHLPPEAWPPTKWFPAWATGRNIFITRQKPPVELRWILCRRS